VGRHYEGGRREIAIAGGNVANARPRDRTSRTFCRRKSLTEIAEALFLESAGARIFAVLHTPEPNASPPPLGLAICSPIADEHVAAYRILRLAADRFCQAGMAVMRFDYRGQGDSEGHFEEMTPEQMAKDTLRALDVMRERTGAKRLAVLGLRVGCAIAMRAAMLDSTLQACIAWAPLPSPERYFRDLLRRQVLSDVMYGENKRSVKDQLQSLRDGGTVDIGGYALPGSLYEPLCAATFAEQAAETTVPLLAALPRRGGKPVEDLAKSLAERPDTLVREIEEEPFWQFPKEGSLAPPPKKLFEETAAWLSAHAASRAEAR
jgi:alpha/beta superfamily hydrolase